MAVDTLRLQKRKRVFGLCGRAVRRVVPNSVACAYSCGTLSPVALGGHCFVFLTSARSVADAAQSAHNITCLRHYLLNILADNRILISYSHARHPTASTRLTASSGLLSATRTMARALPASTPPSSPATSAVSPSSPSPSPASTVRSSPLFCMLLACGRFLSCHQDRRPHPRHGLRRSFACLACDSFPVTKLFARIHAARLCSKFMLGVRSFLSSLSWLRRQGALMHPREVKVATKAMRFFFSCLP